MKRREFIAWLSGGVAGLPTLWPLAARAQTPAPSNQTASSAAADNSIGQVASITGNATVTRGDASRAALKVADVIYVKDTLQTDVNSSLGISFDDETTFSLSANTRIVIDAFVYQQGGSGNNALFNVATGTAAFVANLVAKTGDMKVATPAATLGIRGTTGIVEVPAAGAATAAAPTVKLYPDADGHVGRIELFDRQGGRLGALTQGASAFTLRAGAGGRIAAVPYQNSAARGRTRSRRLAATQPLPQYRAADDHPTATLARAWIARTWIARTWPATPKQSASGRRPELASPGRLARSRSIVRSACPASRGRERIFWTNRNAKAKCL
jgi:FecR protein